MHQGVSVLKDYGSLRTIEGSHGETLDAAYHGLWTPFAKLFFRAYGSVKSVSLDSVDSPVPMTIHLIPNPKAGRE